MTSNNCSYWSGSKCAFSFYFYLCFSLKCVECITINKAEQEIALKMLCGSSARFSPHVPVQGECFFLLDGSFHVVIQGPKILSSCAFEWSLRAPLSSVSCCIHLSWPHLTTREDRRNRLAMCPGRINRLGGTDSNLCHDECLYIQISALMCPYFHENDIFIFIQQMLLQGGDRLGFMAPLYSLQGGCRDMAKQQFRILDLPIWLKRAVL